MSWRDNTSWHRNSKGELRCDTCKSDVFGGVCDCYEESVNQPHNTPLNADEESELDEILRVYKFESTGDYGAAEPAARQDAKQAITKLLEQEIAKARIDERQSLSFSRAYGLAYQATLDYLDEQNDRRIAELSQTLKEHKEQ